MCVFNIAYFMHVFYMAIFIYINIEQLEHSLYNFGHATYLYNDRDAHVLIASDHRDFRKMFVAHKIENLVCMVHFHEQSIRSC